MAADRSLRVPRVRENQPRPSRARRARGRLSRAADHRFSRSRSHDTLTFTRVAAVRSGSDCDDPDCPADARNLVWRAAELVWKAGGPARRAARRRRAICQADPDRRRDWAAAAATRRPPCARSPRSGASDCRRALRAIAAALGADVPYFLEGGTALGLDRGDRLFPPGRRPRAWVVLACRRSASAPGRLLRGGIDRSGRSRRSGGPAGSPAGGGPRRLLERSAAGCGAPAPEIAPRWSPLCGGRARFRRRDVGQRVRCFRPVRPAGRRPSGPRERSGARAAAPAGAGHADADAARMRDLAAK